MNDRERTRTIQVPGADEPARRRQYGQSARHRSSPTPRTSRSAILKVVDGPGKGQERPVFSGTNQVGRSADNRIPLDFGDNTISRQQHAVIAYDACDGEFRIFDGGKQNPVHVNGERLSGDRAAVRRRHDQDRPRPRCASRGFGGWQGPLPRHYARRAATRVRLGSEVCRRYADRQTRCSRRRSEQSGHDHDQLLPPRDRLRARPLHRRPERRQARRRHRAAQPLAPPAARRATCRRRCCRRTS